MSAFTEFLAILWHVTTWILDLTADIICTVLLLIACLVPWRAFIIFHSCHADSTANHRQFCLQHFFLALLDVICLCLGFLGALVPSRTCAFFIGTARLIGQHRHDAGDTGNFCVLWALTFVHGILDAFCLLVCIPSLLIPTRLVAIVHCTWTRLGDLQLVGVNGEFKGESWARGDALRMLWFTSLFKGISEVVGIALGVVAMASLIRSCQTIEEATVAARKRKNWGEDFFNIELTKVLILNGATVLVDLAYVPLLLALAVTVWRFPPALAAIRRHVDWAARATILKQSFLLVSDLLLLVPAAVVLMTWYRSRPMRVVLNQGLFQQVDSMQQPLLPVAGANDWEPFTPYHGTVLRASGLLVLDLLCLPLVLLTAVLAFYRLPLVYEAMGPGLDFHGSVCEQVGEALKDLPFLLAGLLTLCSMYRADIVIGLCRASDRSAAWRRREAAAQLLRVLRDLSMLCLTVPVVASMYRLPALLLGLKVKLSRPLTTDPEMELVAMQIVTPRPTGRVGFRAHASKSPDLSGVTSMQLTVIGEEFWQAIAQAPNLGSFVSQVGRSLLPRKLRDGREISYSAVEHGQEEVEVVVELEQRVKHQTVSNFLGSLPPETRFVLQLEAGLDTGRSVVLAAATCKVGSCLAAAQSEDGAYPIEELLGEESRREIVGSLDQGMLRDAWWPVVLIEFLRVTEDLLHVLLAAMLLVVPWRFASAAKQVLESEARRSARQVHHTQVALAMWQRVCDHVAACLEPLTNRHAKFAAEAATGGQTPQDAAADRRYSKRGSMGDGMVHGVEGCIGFLCCIFFPCCPNYAELADAGALADGPPGGIRDPRSFRERLEALSTVLVEPKQQLVALQRSLPDGPEWSGLASSIDSWLYSQAEYFYWLLLMPQWHVLACKPSSSISEEDHMRMSEKVRARAALAAARQRLQGERLRRQCAAQRAAAEAAPGCGLQSRQASFKILRESFVKALGDLLAVPMMLLLLLTFYRLPGLFSELQHIPWGMDELKEEIRRQALGLAMDVFMLLQFLFLTTLLLVTVVRFPDFISGLQLARGLRPNRDWALVMLSELVVGIGELLLLLTCWKTYRLIVSAAVLAVFCPAAFLAVALELPCSNAFRFSFACAVWLGLLAITLVPGLLPQLVSACVLVLAFGGLCIGNGAKGWLKPRGGLDWWSPIVRISFPNLMALLAIGSEGAILTIVGMRGAAGIGHGLGQFRDCMDTAAIIMVGLSVFLTAVPVVADEADQQSIIRHDAWCGLFALVHEVFFLPVAAVLAPSAVSSWPHTLVLLYFVTIALLSSQAWDSPVLREALLDVRTVGLCSSGARLISVAAVVAAAGGHERIFLILASGSTAWTALWLIAGGASVAWAQVLHLGVGAGACAAVLGGLQVASCVWLVCTVTAVIVGIVSSDVRKRKLLTTEVPAAMAQLHSVQARLSLWADGALVPQVIDASPQGAALQLLELEERLPMERLAHGFLQRRHTWRRSILDSPTYGQVAAGLQELSAAIAVPPSRALLQGLLLRVPIRGRTSMLPRPLAAEIVEFLLEDTLAHVVPSLPESLVQVGNGHADLIELERTARIEAGVLAGKIQSGRH